MSTRESPTPKTERAPGRALRSSASPADLAAQAVEKLNTHKVRLVDLQYADVLGAVKSITIPTERLLQTTREGEWFDGSSVEAFARIFESDMYLKPDMATLAVVEHPGRPATATVICDIYTPEGDRFLGDPRGVLIRALESAAQLGYRYSVATELEFFILRRDGPDGLLKPVAHDRASYFDRSLDPASDVREEMITALSSMGITVEASHHELAPGQYELDFGIQDAITAADQLITVRPTLKALAQRHGLYVSFMPKPLVNAAGSGMHTHQLLMDASRDANAFHDSADQYGLSQIARQFIAGQLAHARGLCAIVAPLVNSYKRFVPGFEAPIAISWAQMNRSALIRVPRTSGEQRSAIRVEFRAPDPSCNPYLTFASMLMAGLDGINQQLPLPPPVEENLFAFDPERVARNQLGLLPRSLDEALQELRHDRILREAIGAHLLERFIEAKQMEWEAYERQVTPWEVENYLEAY